MEGKDKFSERIGNFREEEMRCKRSYGIISLLRFAAFLFSAAFTYLMVQNTNIFSLVGLVLSYALFIYLINLHGKISSKLIRIRNMIKVNERYIQRIEGNWNSFEDTGAEGIGEEYPYLTDIDILGEKSLFQLINTTKTYLGRNKLIASLKNPDKNINNIEKRQEAVKELGERLDFVQGLEGEGIISKITTVNPERLLSYIQNSENLYKSPFIKIFTLALPYVSIISSILIIYFKLRNCYPIIGIFFILHLIVNAAGYIKMAPVLSPIYKMKNDIEAYFSMLNLIDKEEFKSAHLNKLKQELTLNNKPANLIFKELTGITERLEFKSNIFGYVVFSILLLWDYRCLYKFEAWKSKYGNSVSRWLDIIAEFESLSSLSMLFHLNSKLTFPSFSESGLVFRGKEVGHPLIDEKMRVYNDVDMTDSIFIITGSNMSGKTTFLRTVGINLVLAYAGAPVCADNLICSVVDIYTSMRITDDLNRGMSTFYVELIRIKNMIDNVKKEKPMIFLIDEIFRGTNSNDRIVGAKSVLRSLNKDWSFGLISTHDFELCDLEHDDKKRIKNYHFSETYLENKINFDYKLKEGRSDTTNAKYLMKMVGIEINE